MPHPRCPRPSKWEPTRNFDTRATCHKNNCRCWQALALPGFTNGQNGWFNYGVRAVRVLAETRNVRIQEVYRDYAPPFNAAATVHRLLKSVPDKYLAGLDCVVLINEGSLSRRDRLGKTWSRKRKYDKSRILGRYYGPTRSSLPYIELRVDKIIRRLPGLQIYIPLLRYIVFGHVLFHEIGHHIHRTIRPEYTEREDVADNWAGKFNANFLRNQYWYALPILIPIAKLYKFLKGGRWN